MYDVNCLKKTVHKAIRFTGHILRVPENSKDREPGRCARFCKLPISQIGIPDANALICSGSFYSVCLFYISCSTSF